MITSKDAVLARSVVLLPGLAIWLAASCAAPPDPEEHAAEAASAEMIGGSCTYAYVLSHGGSPNATAYVSNTCPDGLQCPLAGANDPTCSWYPATSTASCPCQPVPLACANLAALVNNLGNASFSIREGAQTALRACCTTKDQLAAIRGVVPSWPPGGAAEGQNRLTAVINACSAAVDPCNGQQLGLTSCFCTYSYSYLGLVSATGQCVVRQGTYYLEITPRCNVVATWLSDSNDDDCTAHGDGLSWTQPPLVRPACPAAPAPRPTGVPFSNANMPTLNLGPTEPAWCNNPATCNANAMAQAAAQGICTQVTQGQDSFLYLYEVPACAPATVFPQPVLQPVLLP